MKFTQEITPDKEHIHDLIRAAEARLGCKLCCEDCDFLTKSIATFITGAIDKFVAGAKEHGDGNFVLEVCHSKELEKELIDAWMYSQAWIMRSRK